jgi:hypothetical protein
MDLKSLPSAMILIDRLQFLWLTIIIMGEVLANPTAKLPLADN